MNKYKYKYKYKSGLAGIFMLGIIGSTAAQTPGGNLIYSPVEPCRIFDTRNAGGIIAAGTSRDFFVHGDTDISGQGGNLTGCEAPQGEPVAVALNITLVPGATAGHIRVYPAGTPLPNASTINFSASTNIANALVAKTNFDISDSDLSIYATFDTHVLADVQGYFYPSQKNVIRVSPQYGDFTGPVAALNSIPTTGPDAPSFSNPYLIEIGPGNYPIPTGQQIVMREWVTIVGTGGRSATYLTGSRSGSSFSTDAALVVGADSSELRGVRVQNNGTGTFTVGIGINGTSPTLAEVTTIAVGAADSAGIWVGGSDAEPDLIAVDALGSGGTSGNQYGVRIDDASPSASFLSAEAFGGTNGWGVLATGNTVDLDFENLNAESTGAVSDNIGFEIGANATVSIVTGFIEADDQATFTSGTGELNLAFGVLIGGVSGTFLNNSCFFTTNGTTTLNANCQ